MQVRVLLFGALKEMGSGEGELVNMPEGATVAAVVDHFRALHPDAGPLLGSIAVAVNRQYATRNQQLREGDEVALLPPVSGGSQTAVTGSASRVELVREPIAAEEIVRRIRQGEDGAVVVFDGIVRNNTRGRRTLYLDYEAYEEMALEQMRKLAAAAQSRYAIRDVAIVHRLGRIGIGESSVLVVVAAAHRAAAFDACRWVIDTLKRQVPIWKKEHFEDGAVWVAGEPFPETIAGGAGSQ